MAPAATSNYLTLEVTMSHVTAPSDGARLSDRVVALLRTAVPTLWGTVVAWALARLAGVLPTDLADALGSALQSEAVVALVVLAAVTGWYAAWRWAEPHIPAWLVRIVLGSALTPTYAPQGAIVVEVDEPSRPDRDVR